MAASDRASDLQRRRVTGQLQIAAADPARAAAEGVDPREVDGALGELEARTRRAMLEWGSRLIVRGFAEVFLPLCAYLEAPAVEVLAAMDLVVFDG